MTIKRRIGLLETVLTNEEQALGIKYTVDGLNAQNYKLKVGDQTVETIIRDTGESLEAFEARANTLLDVNAYEQRKSLLTPIMWPDRPPITRSGNHISPSTGKPFRITIGGRK